MILDFISRSLSGDITTEVRARLNAYISEETGVQEICAVVGNPCHGDLIRQYACYMLKAWVQHHSPDSVLDIVTAAVGPIIKEAILASSDDLAAQQHCDAFPPLVTSATSVISAYLWSAPVPAVRSTFYLAADCSAAVIPTLVYRLLGIVGQELLAVAASDPSDSQVLIARALFAKSAVSAVSANDVLQLTTDPNGDPSTTSRLDRSLAVLPVVSAIFGVLGGHLCTCSASLDVSAVCLGLSVPKGAASEAHNALRGRLRGARRKRKQKVVCPTSLAVLCEQVALFVAILEAVSVPLRTYDGLHDSSTIRASPQTTKVVVMAVEALTTLFAREGLLDRWLASVRPTETGRLGELLKQLVRMVVDIGVSPLMHLFPHLFGRSCDPPMRPSCPSALACELLHCSRECLVALSVVPFSILSAIVASEGASPAGMIVRYLFVALSLPLLTWHESIAAARTLWGAFPSDLCVAAVKDVIAMSLQGASGSSAHPLQHRLLRSAMTLPPVQLPDLVDAGLSFVAFVTSMAGHAISAVFSDSMRLGRYSLLPSSDVLCDFHGESSVMGSWNAAQCHGSAAHLEAYTIEALNAAAFGIVSLTEMLQEYEGDRTALIDRLGGPASMAHAVVSCFQAAVLLGMSSAASSDIMNCNFLCSLCRAVSAVSGFASIGLSECEAAMDVVIHGLRIGTRTRTSEFAASTEGTSIIEFAMCLRSIFERVSESHGHEFATSSCYPVSVFGIASCCFLGVTVSNDTSHAMLTCFDVLSSVLSKTCVVGLVPAALTLSRVLRDMFSMMYLRSSDLNSCLSIALRCSLAASPSSLPCHTALSCISTCLAAIVPTCVSFFSSNRHLPMDSDVYSDSFARNVMFALDIGRHCVYLATDIAFRASNEDCLVTFTSIHSCILQMQQSIFISFVLQERYFPTDLTEQIIIFFSATSSYFYKVGGSPGQEFEVPDKSHFESILTRVVDVFCAMSTGAVQSLSAEVSSLVSSTIPLGVSVLTALAALTGGTLRLTSFAKARMHLELGSCFSFLGAPTDMLAAAQCLVGGGISLGLILQSALEIVQDSLSAVSQVLRAISLSYVVLQLRALVRSSPIPFAALGEDEGNSSDSFTRYCLAICFHAGIRAVHGDDEWSSDSQDRGSTDSDEGSGMLLSDLLEKPAFRCEAVGVDVSADFDFLPPCVEVVTGDVMVAMWRRSIHPALLRASVPCLARGDTAGALIGAASVVLSSNRELARDYSSILSHEELEKARTAFGL